MVGDSLVTTQMVVSAVQRHLSGRVVEQVIDCGMWIRHNYRITLDGGELVHVKVDESFPASVKEAHICELLRTNGLPAPRVLAVDSTCALIPYPFIIQEHVAGERLGRLLKRVDASDRIDIYRVLGRFYRRLHSIHNQRSGWIQEDGSVLQFSPTLYQYDQVIVKIGGEAVRRGLLSAGTYERLKQLWSNSIVWLEQHVPSLVGGALHWTVCLAKDDNWRVTRVMDLHDFLYWDPVWEIASILCPVFCEPPTLKQREAFVCEYGSVPDEKRLRLYALMQHIDAAMGNYMEPPAPEHEHWKASVWESFDRMVSSIKEDSGCLSS